MHRCIALAVHSCRGQVQTMDTRHYFLRASLQRYSTVVYLLGGNSSSGPRCQQRAVPCLQPALASELEWLASDLQMDCPTQCQPPHSLPLLQCDGFSRCKAYVSSYGGRLCWYGPVGSLSAWFCICALALEVRCKPFASVQNDCTGNHATGPMS